MVKEFLCLSQVIFSFYQKIIFYQLGCALILPQELLSSLVLIHRIGYCGGSFTPLIL